MGLSVNSNIASLTAQRNLNESQGSLNTSLQRLSSGLRINSARDDAAGLAISNSFTSQVRGLDQAIRNANDGISLAQVAEGALQESTNILQRIRELSIQSANGSNGGSERAALQQEVGQLQEELNRISSTTSFGDRVLLDGSFGTESFQVGAQANQTIGVTLTAASSNDIGSNRIDFDGTAIGAAGTAGAAVPASTVLGTTFTVNGNLGSAAVTYQAADSARSIAGAINAEQGNTGVSADARTVATFSALNETGVLSLDLQGTGPASASISVNVTSVADLSDLATAINQQSAATGVTATADGGTVTLVNEAGDDIQISNFAIAGSTTETATVTARNYDDTATTGAAASTSSLTNANVATRVQGQLRVDSSAGFNISGADATVATTVASSLETVASVNISTQAGAQSAIAVIDAAIQGIDSQRAGIGAVQNRLSSTISNLSSVSENVSAARSQIQDADFAKETANLTRTQILQQAGISVLAQANALPQQVLGLLQ
jgi:flagellin